MMTAALGRCWQNLSGASSKSHSVPISFTHSCTHREWRYVCFRCTHTHIHTYTHTFLLQIHTHTCMLTHTLVCVHVRTQTPTLTPTQVNTATNTHTLTHTHGLTLMYMHPKITTPAKINSQSIHTHPHTTHPTHSRTHTHTHIYRPLTCQNDLIAISKELACDAMSQVQWFGTLPAQLQQTAVGVRCLGKKQKTSNTTLERGPKHPKRLKRTLILVRQYTK